MKVKNYYFKYNEDKDIISLDDKKVNTDKCIILGIINWKIYNIKLHVCYFKNNIRKNKYTWLQKKKKCIYNSKKHMSILKSNLQKRIRRGIVNSSLKSALTILCINQNELLRRLPIILLEDVSITNDYPFLIWLMCASSKNFILSDYLVIKILNIIKQMCNHKIKTNYKKEIKHFNILDKEFKKC